MTKLYPYQKKVYKTIKQFLGRVLLAMEMGTGKTIIVLKYLKRHPELRPALIVCPASLKWVWEEQARTHCNLRTTIINGRYTKKREPYDKDIIIINYDVLSSWADYLIKLNLKVVAADEVHFIKSSKSKRTKALKQVCKNVPHVIGMSGTPLTNRPAELFSILNILWPKEFPYWTPFAHRHCAPRLMRWGWDFRGASHLGELHDRLKKLGMIRKLKKDVLKDLPEKTRIVVPLEIEKRKEYQRALSDFIAWLGERSPAKAEKAKKAEELTKLNYTIQLAAELKMKSVFEWIDTFLEETNEKLVLFCCHTNIVNMIKERYKKISVVITGATSKNNRKLAVENFQKNKKIRIFIGNIKAAGVGIDLWSASTMAFVEMGWVSEDLIQAEDRLHRIGQKKKVFCYYLVAKDTVEEYLCQIVQKKHDIVTSVLDGKSKTPEVRLGLHDKLVKILEKKF